MQKINPYMKYLFLIVLVCFFVLLFFVIPGFQGAYGRKVLLQKKNYQELLKAGRELISKAEWEETVTLKDNEKVRRLIIPKDVKIPEYIHIIPLQSLNLYGSLHIFNDRCLEISYGDHITGNFGVRIYPNDFNKTEGYYNYGDKMLIPGLWYFDAGYQEFGTEYDREIESMIKKNKYLNQTKQLNQFDANN
jgi:hypothetical protein